MSSILQFLRQFWAEARIAWSTNGGAPVRMDARTVGVFVLACVLLTVFYYFGRPTFFRQPDVELLIAGWTGLDDSHYRDLIPYMSWAVASVVIRILIPLGFIWLVLRDSAADYGFRMWKKGHGKIYVGLFLFMLPILVAISFDGDFQSKYPFYDNADKSWAHFTIYQLAYGTQFFSLEAFFRGFLVFALFKKFGYYAVLIMTVPYCMIHFEKPLPETLGAIIAGLALGYLAIQSRSWIPGALLHWGVGLTMDVLVLAHEYLPVQ